jgi:hypothetical protein
MCLNKKSVLLLTFLLAVLGMVLVESSVAYETKPATPTFTVEEITQSYDVPPSYTKDPYTGETITHPGYTVENKNIYIKIKNQPLTQPNNGSILYLYYQYRYKGHYSNDDWYLVPSNPKEYFEQTDSEYTRIPYYDKLPRKEQVDIEVRALIGVVEYVSNYMPPVFAAHYEFRGVEGDWSNTVVVTFDPLTFTTLPPNNLAPSTLHSSTPSVPSTNSPSNILPTSEPHNPLSKNSWATNLLITLAIVCIITIPLVIIAYCYGKRKTENGDLNIAYYCLLLIMNEIDSNVGVSYNKWGQKKRLKVVWLG